MVGVRVDSRDALYEQDAAGSYWLHPEVPRALWFVDPHGHIGRVTAGRWTITEHEDGTVTVAPSINDLSEYGDLDDHPGKGWHGFLERGVWRDA